MRRPALASLLIALALPGCELRPAPPAQREAAAGSAAPAAPTPPAPPAPVAPAADGAAAGSAAPAVSEPCLQVSAHIADTLIAQATDPAQKAALAQERAKIVRRSAEGCTRDAWTKEQLACFLAATTVPALQECGKNLQAP